MPSKSMQEIMNRCKEILRIHKIF